MIRLKGTFSKVFNNKGVSGNFKERNGCTLFPGTPFSPSSPIEPFTPGLPACPFAPWDPGIPLAKRPK